MNPLLKSSLTSKALYEEQWGDAEATAPPEFPGEIAMEEENETKVKIFSKQKNHAEEKLKLKGLFLLITLILTHQIFV